jgi:hypothetical protein
MSDSMIRENGNPIRLGSDDWVRLAERTLQELVTERQSEISESRVHICEVFTDVPDDLPGRDSRGRSAWNFLIDRGGVRVERGESDDADIKLLIDYQSVLPLARTIYTDDPVHMAEVARYREQLESQGKMVTSGDRSATPAALAGLLSELHNRLAIAIS